MPRRNSDNKYTERDRSRTGRYSTVYDETARASGPVVIKKKKNPAGMIIAVLMVLVIVAIGTYVFFNFDNFTDMSNETLEQINGTPTPVPTKMATATPTPMTAETPTPTVSPTPIASATPPPDIVDITISAVGDIMVNQAQLDDAYDEETDTYDFSHNFEEIKASLADSDLVIGNILTTFAGEEYGYSGTTLFNTPDSFLDALYDAGFDVLTTANTHIFDYGWIGLERTNEKIKNAGMMSTGTYLSEEEYYEPLIVDVSGINVAILAFADEVFEEDEISDTKLSYCIKYIRRSRIEDTVELAQQKGADVIIVCLSWGEEYERTPTDDQRELAQYILELGVDAIIGTKSHVIQLAKTVTVEDVNGDEKDRVVAYSLGNFISNQRSPYKDSGMILNMHFQIDNTTDEIVFTGADYVPTWVSIDETDGTEKNFQVLPVGKYLEDAELLSTLTESAIERLQEVWNETTSVIGTALLSALNE